MPKQRDPKRERAFELWRDSGGQKDLVEIAAELNVSAGSVRGWKSKDNWEANRNGTLQSLKRNAPKNTERSKRGGAPPGNQFAKGHGAPKGNRNAKGNRGGDGGPPRNDKASTHGFFRKYFPAESVEIMEQIEIASPIDILWQNIVIQYTAIVRAQQIMFVRDQDDTTKALKKVMDMESGAMNEWEYQFAWDKHANFLQAQSRAMTTLQGLITRYDDLINKGLADEEQKLRISKLKAEIMKLKGDEGPLEDDGFIDALKGKVADVWSENE